MYYLLVIAVKIKYLLKIKICTYEFSNIVVMMTLIGDVKVKIKRFQLINAYFCISSKI